MLLSINPSATDPKTTLLRYGAGVAAIVFTTVVRMALDPILGDRVPFTGILGAIAAVAWFGGRGPGLLAMALGFSSTWFFFMPPRQSFHLKNPVDLMQLVIFALVGGAVTLLVGPRRAANEALRESEERLRAIASAAPEILFTATSDGGMDFLSNRFSEYSGRSVAGAMPGGWIEILHPEDKDHAVTAWKHCVQTRSECQIKFRLRRRDGVYRWFQCHAIPMADGGDGAKWFGVCVDIDDLKRLEDELSHRSEDLARSNEDLQRFAYVASHDLQEPLRIVRTLSELLVVG